MTTRIVVSQPICKKDPIQYKSSRVKSCIAVAASKLNGFRQRKKKKRLIMTIITTYGIRANMDRKRKSGAAKVNLAKSKHQAHG